MYLQDAEFSAFDLSVAHAVATPDFDVGICLQQRIQEQEATGVVDEEELTVPFDAVPAPPSTSVAPIPTPMPDPPLASLSAKQHNNKKSRQRCPRSRSTDLPDSKPAWLGSCAAGTDEFTFIDPQPPHDLDTGLGGLRYTQQELDELSGTEGFKYISWLGILTIPILDSKRRVIALLGGMPRNTSGWQIVTDGAAKLMDEHILRIRLTDEQLDHRRSQDPFPAITRGWSHGGGQTEPGELCCNVANTELTDELLQHDDFKHLATFASTHRPQVLFAMWVPLLFAFYQVQMALLAAWKPSLQRNFAGSVFAACTFNFGPRVITAPHLDFANLAWGWCAITALGNFNPDFGGHLILWDLRLIIRFPPGATILLPSALIRHSNIAIRSHESRYSFTQYTAGGIFRWIRNDFKTDEAFERTASRDG
ncbi:hypothetical protein C8R43DRAFT_944932 [Mycena crocata]|nr:hypothetical protein C8R43DRAFT_944932 [Mycena crocata]